MGGGVRKGQGITPAIPNMTGGQIGGSVMITGEVGHDEITVIRRTAGHPEKGV